jgi:hypothetical protein
VSFEPVAILLSNQPSEPKKRLVYTPQKSESAYILAALAVRQAAIQTAIWVGHVSPAGCATVSHKQQLETPPQGHSPPPPKGTPHTRSQVCSRAQHPHP